MAVKVFHSEEITQAEGRQNRSAEKNIWAEERKTVN
jgi:hypothetical protein